MLCPCESQLAYLQCCGQYIEDTVLPPTPETLMRSRYTAFALNKQNYIQSTMRGKALTQSQKNHKGEPTQEVVWEGLTILSAKMKSDRHGFVTFKATYRIQDKFYVLHEKK